MDKSKLRRLIECAATGLAKVVHATNETTSIIDEACMSTENLNYQLHQYYLEKQAKNNNAQ